MESLKKCPICEHGEYNLYLQATDNLVSGKTFDVIQCNNCSFIFTNPRPKSESISAYYNSEDYISHAGRSTSLIDKIYNLIRDKNISYKLRLIKKYVGNKASIYDYGCGVGTFLQAAKRHALDVKGFEPTEKAKEIAIKSGISIESVDDLLERDQSFDVITLWHVLEHIHDLNETIEKLKKLLKDNGALVIAVPIVDSWDALNYQSKWAALDVPRHLYHFTSSTIGQFFRKFGMSVVDMYPLKFDSYYISLLSERNTVLKYFRAICNGWVSNMKARKSKKYSSLIFIIQNAKE